MIDISDLDNPVYVYTYQAAAQDLAEIAFFDTFPANDNVGFDAAWSVYPYFPSGNLIVNVDANGLFVLTMQ